MTVIDEFEAAFATFTHAAHAIACCNGTAALHTALVALDIGAGDNVVTTPFSFVATANAILHAGATPVFADIDPHTYCIDPTEVANHLQQDADIAAILCVHLFGHPCDMDQLIPLAAHYQIPLIEDCAQALGATVDNHHVGTFGDVGCFSFYASKNLSTFEGGMLITQREDVAEQARILINHGMDRRHHMVRVGYNYRMSQLTALLGKTTLQLHQPAIYAELGRYGLDDGYYPYVIYQQPAYKALGITGNCPHAEAVAQRVKEMMP